MQNIKVTKICMHTYTLFHRWCVVSWGTRGLLEPLLGQSLVRGQEIFSWTMCSVWGLRPLCMSAHSLVGDQKTVGIMKMLVWFVKV